MGFGKLSNIVSGGLKSGGTKLAFAGFAGLSLSAVQSASAAEAHTATATVAQLQASTAANFNNNGTTIAFSPAGTTGEFIDITNTSGSNASATFTGPSGASFTTGVDGMTADSFGLVYQLVSGSLFVSAQTYIQAGSNGGFSAVQATSNPQVTAAGFTGIADYSANASFNPNAVFQYGASFFVGTTGTARVLVTPIPSSSPAPEPASIGLLALAAPMLLKRRRV